MHNFKELKIWSESIELVEKIYQLTESFPTSEQFGLTNQIRRCSVSVPSNIAEGSGGTDKEFCRYLTISLSSAFELETQLIIAKRLKYIDDPKHKEISEFVVTMQKMIFGFKNKLTKDLNI